MAITFTLNGEEKTVDVDPAMPLLWVVRDVEGLTGSKFGCGIAQCGACTMHIDGEAQRTCVLPVSAVAGKSVTTIEGLGQGDALHRVQQAWIEEDVPQCGYCQSGMIMAAAALVDSTDGVPSDEEIAEKMDNICRCGTYTRVRAAIKRAAQA